LLVIYLLDIPSLENFKVWKFNFSEKFFVYILSFQMLLSNFPNSLLAGVCGIFSGILFRFKPLKLKFVTWPDLLVKICQKIQPYINKPLILNNTNYNQNNFNNNQNNLNNQNNNERNNQRNQTVIFFLI
jgi:hypothetical protein